MTLHDAYNEGRRAAFRRFKVAAPAPTHPTVKESPLLRSQSGDAPSPQQLQAPTHPDAIKQVFDATEQSKTRIEPNKKLAEDLCTTCRKPKHYGPCLKPSRTRPDGSPLKSAGFNMGLKGDDPQFVGSGESGPSTSPHYHSATTADSSLARARDGRPADEQAATGFADLFRHLGIDAPADEWTDASGALVKVQSWNPLVKSAYEPMLGAALHSRYEQRGPTVNPYEERITKKSPPVAFGDEGDQRIERAFDQIDGAVDTANIEGQWGGPATGPEVLG